MMDGQLPAAAPFLAELAEGPLRGQAYWLRTVDGVRIRIAVWPGGSRGTVLLLPGRTEYVEKYGRVAAELLAQGWSVLSIDWRGQGMADRFLPDPMLGHVGRFSDYQYDLDAALDWLKTEGPALGLQGPLMMLAHSMGGLIGLRALYRDLPIEAAAFSAPMWGIQVPFRRRAMAEMLRRLPMALRQDLGYSPTTSDETYVLATRFEDNHLTGDADIWDYLHRHVVQEPAFRLGGPSLGWMRSALNECVSLMQRPALKLPAFAAFGTAEAIVKPGPIRKRMRDWPLGSLEVYPGARHELTMERREYRDRFFGSAVGLFNSLSRRAEG